MLAHAALATLLLGAATALDCTLKTEGASFDLTDLKKVSPTKSYDVTGGDFICTEEEEASFRYFFNVCGDVVNKPAECVAQSEVDAPVFQVKPPGSASADCHVAGTITADTKLELINPENPAEGVKLSYTGGSRCAHDRANNAVPAGQGAPRETTINFHCTRDRLPNPTNVLERDAEGRSSHCEYVIEVDTMFGCPKECPISGRDLCAGHGVCDWDKTNGAAKCFCDSGWTGVDCATEGGDDDGNGNGGMIAMLVIMLLLMIAMFAVIGILVRQVRAYRNDAANYMTIRQQEMTIESI